MATDALSLARRAREAWEDKEDKEKVTVGVVKKHFDALEAEIARLTLEINRVKNELANITVSDALAQEKEIARLNAEIKSIHRQHASERPSW
jgi:septal ring factor EnvC (AmiA/AmiB activator)